MKLKLQVVLLPVTSADIPTSEVLSYKKFLHLSDPACTIGQVCDSLILRYYRLYPDADQLVVEGVQDNDRCDLDPEFVAEDVFGSGDVLRILVDNVLPAYSRETTILADAHSTLVGRSLKRRNDTLDATDSLFKRSRTIWGLRKDSSVLRSSSPPEEQPANRAIAGPSSPVSLPPPPHEATAPLIPHKRDSPVPARTGRRITSGMLHAPLPEPRTSPEHTKNDHPAHSLAVETDKNSSEPEEIENGTDSDNLVSNRLLKNIGKRDTQTSFANPVKLAPPVSGPGKTPSKKAPMITLTPAKPIATLPKPSVAPLVQNPHDAQVSQSKINVYGANVLASQPLPFSPPVKPLVVPTLTSSTPSQISRPQNLLSPIGNLNVSMDLPLQRATKVAQTTPGAHSHKLTAPTSSGQSTPGPNAKEAVVKIPHVLNQPLSPKKMPTGLAKSYSLPKVRVAPTAPTKSTESNNASKSPVVVPVPLSTATKNSDIIPDNDSESSVPPSTLNESDRRSYLAPSAPVTSEGLEKQKSAKQPPAENVNLSKEEILGIFKHGMRIPNKITKKLSGPAPDIASFRDEEEEKRRIIAQRNMEQNARELDNRLRAATANKAGSRERNLRSRVTLQGVANFVTNLEVGSERDEEKEKAKDQRENELPHPFSEFVSKSKLSSVFVKLKKLDAKITTQLETEAQANIAVKDEPSTPKMSKMTIEASKGPGLNGKPSPTLKPDFESRQTLSEQREISESDDAIVQPVALQSAATSQPESESARTTPVEELVETSDDFEAEISSESESDVSDSDESVRIPIRVNKRTNAMTARQQRQRRKLRGSAKELAKPSSDEDIVLLDSSESDSEPVEVVDPLTTSLKSSNITEAPTTDNSEVKETALPSVGTRANIGDEAIQSSNSINTPTKTNSPSKTDTPAKSDILAKTHTPAKTNTFANSDTPAKTITPTEDNFLVDNNTPAKLGTPTRSATDTQEHTGFNFQPKSNKDTATSTVLVVAVAKPSIFSQQNQKGLERSQQSTQPSAVIPKSAKIASSQSVKENNPDSMVIDSHSSKSPVVKTAVANDSSTATIKRTLAEPNVSPKRQKVEAIASHIVDRKSSGNPSLASASTTKKDNIVREVNASSTLVSHKSKVVNAEKDAKVADIKNGAQEKPDNSLKDSKPAQKNHPVQKSPLSITGKAQSVSSPAPKNKVAQENGSPSQVKQHDITLLKNQPLIEPKRPSESLSQEKIQVTPKKVHTPLVKISSSLGNSLKETPLKKKVDAAGRNSTILVKSIKVDSVATSLLEANTGLSHKADTIKPFSINSRKPKAKEFALGPEKVAGKRQNDQPVKISGVAKTKIGANKESINEKKDATVQPDSISVSDSDSSESESESESDSSDSDSDSDSDSSDSDSESKTEADVKKNLTAKETSDSSQVTTLILSGTEAPKPQIFEKDEVRLEQKKTNDSKVTQRPVPEVNAKQGNLFKNPTMETKFSQKNPEIKSNVTQGPSTDNSKLAQKPVSSEVDNKVNHPPKKDKLDGKKENILDKKTAEILREVSRKRRESISQKPVDSKIISKKTSHSVLVESSSDSSSSEEDSQSEDDSDSDSSESEAETAKKASAKPTKGTATSLVASRLLPKRLNSLSSRPLPKLAAVNPPAIDAKRWNEGVKTVSIDTPFSKSSSDEEKSRGSQKIGSNGVPPINVTSSKTAPNINSVNGRPTGAKQTAPTRASPVKKTLLTSLADLASRGVPDVLDAKEKNKVAASQKVEPAASDSESGSESESSSSSDSSDSESDSDLDSSGDEKSSKFVSLKKLSANNKTKDKKKSKNGFFSMMKDARKK